MINNFKYRLFDICLDDEKKRLIIRKVVKLNLTVCYINSDNVVNKHEILLLRKFWFELEDINALIAKEVVF